MTVRTAEPFGVYVHIPFCRSRCDYCAFATWTDRHHLMGDYATACVTEIQAAAEEGMPAATSVFFGGGTPSLLPAADLARILASIRLAPGAEVSVECNPDDVTPALLAAYRSAGVNRLSIGVQSMVPAVLDRLGRHHDPAAVGRAVAAAGAEGFAGAFSVDLIYGTVGESIDDWRRSVEAVLALEPSPTHLSAYGLTVEPGTPLAADRARYPDDDDQADKYAVVDDLLAGASLDWYELSNWAVPGAECRHNQLYWQQGSYRGIGCAAHSHQRNPDGRARRWWNVRTPDRYIRLVAAGQPTEAAGEDLDPAQGRSEAVHLALRTRQGVALTAVRRSAVDELVDAGLIVVAAPDESSGRGAVTGTLGGEGVGSAGAGGGGRVVLTRRGRLLANEVIVRLAP